MRTVLLCFIAFLYFSCENQGDDLGLLELTKVTIGDQDINLFEPYSEELPLDRSITLAFSSPINPATVPDGISLLENDQPVDYSSTLSANNTAIVIRPGKVLKENTNYKIMVSDRLRSGNGGQFVSKEIRFKTQIANITITSFSVEGAEEIFAGRMVNASLDLGITMEFSSPLNPDSFTASTQLTGQEKPQVDFLFSSDHTSVKLSGEAPLRYLTKYTISISDELKGAEGQGFKGFNQTFYSRVDDQPKFSLVSNDELLNIVQEQTFRYFWDFAHPNSGMSRDRNTSGNLVTTGGSGFGVMVIIVGIERGFITRQEGVKRLEKIVNFLEVADRFHGAWPHWMNGNTGEVIPFSEKDNGGDLVETALMIQGLLTVRAYLSNDATVEKAIKDKITRLWQEVEWDWYKREGEGVLYWHWSPEYGWEIDLPIRGYNEALIVYVLAAASPSHPIEKSTYDEGWARNGGIVNGNRFFGHQLLLGNDLGGPLFFAHYSFLGLDPRNLKDQYADYWKQNINHTLINRGHCISNPFGHVGYGENSWGLTASDNQAGYSAHSPTNDRGVITPTAALSSIPYTPDASMAALAYFYYQLGDRIWGEYGFYDAFNITEEWYADSYLAIDQGPILLMIENYRSALLWETFMKDPDVKLGLEKLGFTTKQ